MELILYFLVFMFGYVTHRTFWTFRSTKSILLLLQSAQITSLLILARSIEKYSYVKAFGANQLTKSGATDDAVDNYKKYIDNDIEYFKSSSIKNIVRNTPEHFEPIVQFSDWNSAMEYLDNLNQTRMGNIYDKKN